MLRFRTHLLAVAVVSMLVFPLLGNKTSAEVAKSGMPTLEKPQPAKKCPCKEKMEKEAAAIPDTPPYIPKKERVAGVRAWAACYLACRALGIIPSDCLELCAPYLDDQPIPSRPGAPSPPKRNG